MEKYKNLSMQSDNIEYECGDDFITLVFNGKKLYHYSTKSMELQYIKYMCMLAVKGKGLRNFINSKETRHLVQHEYSRNLY